MISESLSLLTGRWEEKFSVCDAWGVEIILEVGEADRTSRGRLVESRDLPTLAYWQGGGVCLRRMDCQPWTANIASAASQ
jgi:hypothetical protein